MDRREEPMVDWDLLYNNRKFIQGCPNLEKLGSKYKENQMNNPKNYLNAKRYNQNLIKFCSRITDIDSDTKRALDIGCGPVPLLVQELIESGFDAHGIEPVESMRKRAQQFLNDESKIVDGCSEKIPFEDNSQNIVFLNGVLEHVDSPVKTLNEIYRVLAPRGIVYISTTNKYMVKNFEYTKIFYQWYPSIIKESYVFLQLHYKPDLARFSSRPAVHWFCYSDLCKLGRNSGFSSFYSFLDLIDKNDESLSKKIGKFKIFLPLIKYNPLCRSFILTFTSQGSSIFMVKRE